MKHTLLLLSWFFLATHWFNPPTGGPIVLLDTRVGGFASAAACQTTRDLLSAIPTNAETTNTAGFSTTCCFDTETGSEVCSDASTPLRRMH